MYFGDNLTLVNDFSYVGVDQKRYFVTHGDMFDTITMTKKWLAVLGDKAYVSLLAINRPLNKIRRFVGYKKFWSLSKYLKHNVKNQ